MNLGFLTRGARIVFWCLCIPLLFGVGYIAQAIGKLVSFDIWEGEGFVLLFVVPATAFSVAYAIAFLIDDRIISRRKEEQQEKPDENH